MASTPIGFAQEGGSPPSPGAAVPTPKARSSRSRYVTAAQITLRSYKTLEGALGAAHRLSLLEGLAEVNVWRRAARGFTVHNAQVFAHGVIVARVRAVDDWRVSL